MRKKRFLIVAPINADGTPNTTGIDHATLDGGVGQQWFGEVCQTWFDHSPVVTETPMGTVSQDVPVYDANFVFYPYSLHPAIDGRYPAFQFLRTGPIVTDSNGTWARGILFIDVEESDGLPADDVAAVFGGLLSQITILAVETYNADGSSTWTPSNVVTTNENLAVLA
jgi:hypothetical protein